jgi:hypothetical protein
MVTPNTMTTIYAGKSGTITTDGYILNVESPRTLGKAKQLARRHKRKNRISAHKAWFLQVVGTKGLVAEMTNNAARLQDLSVVADNAEEALRELKDRSEATYLKSSEAANKLAEAIVPNCADEFESEEVFAEKLAEYKEIREEAARTSAANFELTNMIPDAAKLAERVRQEHGKEARAAAKHRAEFAGNVL